MMSNFFSGRGKIVNTKADDGVRQESQNNLLKFRYCEKVPKFEKKNELINYVGYGKTEKFISMVFLKIYSLHRDISFQ